MSRRGNVGQSIASCSCFFILEEFLITVIICFFSYFSSISYFLTHFFSACPVNHTLTVFLALKKFQFPLRISQNLFKAYFNVRNLVIFMVEHSGALLLETHDQPVTPISSTTIELKVERSGALLPQTHDQSFTPISSTTIEPIVLKMCIYVVLLSEIVLF